MLTSIKKVKNWLLYSKKYRNFITNLKLVRLTKVDFENKDLRQKIFDTYRDIFGHTNEGWGEYVKCTSCNSIYGIEKIHELKMYTHLSDLSRTLPTSLCCQAPLAYFHDEASLEHKFEVILSKQDSIMYILNDESIGKIAGLIIGCIDSAEVVWNEHIKDKLVLKDKEFPDHSLSRERVVYIDELGIIKTHRQGNVPLFLQLATFLESIKLLGGAEEILFWTSENSKLYKLIQQQSHKVIVRDLQIPPCVVIGMSFREAYKKVRLIHMMYT